MGLEPNVAALLAYAVGWLSGLVIFLIEKENDEVRYHAAQSIVVFGALTIVGFVFSALGVIPVLGLVFLLVSILVWIASLPLWIYLMIQGYQLNHIKLPVAGDYAEKLATQGL